MRNGIDEWVKVESWQVRILRFDKDHIRCVIPARGHSINYSCGTASLTPLPSPRSTPNILPGEMDMVGKIVVKIGEGNLVLCPDWLADDDFVYVVELVPILIPF